MTKFYNTKSGFCKFPFLQLMLLVGVFFAFSGNTFAQSNPTAQSLPYTQDFSGLSSSSTTYPAGWQGWKQSASPGSSYSTAAPSANQALSASATAATSGGAVNNYNGKIGWVNTSSNDYGICLAIDATGKTNINVTYDFMTIRNVMTSSGPDNRVNEVSLQYRVGTTGTFTTITNPTTPYTNYPYQNTSCASPFSCNQTGAVTTPQNNLTTTVVLPAACNGQSVVQLRWISRQVSGSGNRPGFAVDNVSIDGCTAPSSASTSLSFSSVSSTGMTVSWTNGGGTKRIAVIKSGSAQSTFPSDNKTYVADNTTYTSGDSVGTGDGNVVYNGTGTSVAISNLSPSTTYYFSVYDYNCVPGDERYDRTALSGSQATNAGNSITTGAISGSPFCATATTGASVRVPLSSIGTYTSNTYTAYLSDASGSFASPTSIGTLSSNANTDTINATIPAGITAGSGYRIRVTASSPAVTGTDNGSNLVVATSTVNVTNLAASIANGQTVITWTNPAGCYDDVLIVAKALSNVNSGTPTSTGSVYTKSLTFGSGSSLLGGYVIYQGSASGQTLTGLTNGTQYFIKIFTRKDSTWTSGAEVSVNPNTTGRILSAPVPFDLSSANYYFTYWSSTATTATYPPNMIFHYLSAADPTVTDSAYQDYYGSYTCASATRIVGNNGAGFSFVNTSGNGCDPSGPATSLGEAVLALNTTGLSAVKVQWHAGTKVVSATRSYKIRAQYRVGSVGAFTDLPYSSISDIEYTSSSTAGDSMRFGPITLPAAAENKPNVQIRWVYFVVSGGSSTRPELRVDSIYVTGSACNTPTAASTSLNFSGLSSTQMDLAWTSGTGTGAHRIVIAKAGSAPGATPSNNTTYTANSAFGTGGTSIATGEYVVYNGTGTSVTVTGLSANTTYYYAIYEYGCTPGSEKYYSTPLTGSQITNVGNSITTSSITGSPFCVTATDSAAVSVGFSSVGIYTSGNTYTAQLSNSTGSFTSPTTIGSISNTTTGSQSINAKIPAGISAGTQYRIRVVSSNPSTTGSDNGANLTVNTSPVDVTALGAVAGNGQATINWTNPTAACFNDVLIVVNQGSAVSNTPSGTGSAYTPSLVYGGGTPIGASADYTVYQGTSSGQVITGLTNGADYYITVFVRYGSTWTTGATTFVTPNIGTVYYSRGSGTTATALWSTSRTAGSGATVSFNTSSSPSSPSTTSIVIQSGHTIEMAASNININNITVETGGKLWRNDNNSANMRYFNIYGNIKCDGLIGKISSGSPAFDAIGFNMEGTSDTIYGSGQFYGARVRKSLGLSTTTNVVFNMNSKLLFPGTCIYSNNASSNYLNIIIPLGITLDITDNSATPGSISIDGVDGSGSGERGGCYYINGTLNVAGTVYATTTNATNRTKILVGPNATLSCSTIVATASGAAKDSFILGSGALLKITGINGGFTGFVTSNNYYQIDPTSTVEYAATGAQTIETGLTYSNLKLSGSGNKSFTGTLNIDKNIDITGSSNFVPNSSDIINLKGNWTTYSNTAFQAGTSTVNLLGSNNHTVKSVGAYPNDREGFSTLNLLTSTDTLTLGSHIQVSNALSVNGTLQGGTYAIRAKASTSPTATFGSGASIYTENADGTDSLFSLGIPTFASDNNFSFAAAYTQHMGSRLPTTIQDLVVDNSAGTTYLDKNITINGTAYITSGILITLNDTMTLGASGSLSEGSSKYVQGVVQATRTVSSGVNETFGNIGIEINPAGTAPGSTLVIRTTGIADSSQVLHGGIRNESVKRFFDIFPTANGGLNADIVFHYNDGELNSISESDLSLYRRSHTGGNYELKGYTTRDASGNTISLSSVDSFSRWTAGGTNSNALPVTLVTFTAHLKNDQTATLNWMTASEINNSHFDIERSENAKNFVKVGEKLGHGTSNVAQQYSFEDIFGANVLSPVLYYRLKQVDFNGNFEYSAILSSTVGSEAWNSRDLKSRPH